MGSERYGTVPPDERVLKGTGNDQYYRKSSLIDYDMPLINCREITRAQDDWDVEEFISKTCMSRFLHHSSFKILIACVIIGNAIIIALRTEPTLENNYFGLFNTVDTIVLSFLLCEVLLNWYYGFNLYWKDGWNIINFCIVTYLCLGLLIPALENQTLFRMVRVMRLIQVCSLVSGLARMIQVILKSIPDMANIMILLFAIMLVFSVFGVTLFGALVPKHFGNLGTALYSLFICVTQDGWISIYNDFEKEGLALEIGGALYFFIFITFGAFIFANLLVAVVTTNLEQSMHAYQEKQQLKTFSTLGTFAAFEDGGDDDYTTSASEAVHVKEVLQSTPMVHHQELLSLGNLGNLTETTCEDLCLVLEAIHENLKEYQIIRDELDHIVQEVRSLKFNLDHEQEIVLRHIRGANMSETMIANNTIYAKTGDVLSTLMNLEKVWFQPWVLNDNEGLALEIGGALYFFIFITFGAFIFANLLVAVVTTNLEQSMHAYQEKQQLKTFSTLGTFAAFEDGGDDDYTTSASEAVHVKEVLQSTPMVHHQELLSLGNLGNLTETTCEDLCLVLEAIHENLKEYQIIRDELDHIVQEVRSLKFNLDHEQEIVLRHIRGANMSETMIANNTIYAKTGDVLSTLMNLEKSHLIDGEYQKGEVKSAAMRALRQSALDESDSSGRRQTLPAKFEKQPKSSLPGFQPDKFLTRRTTLPAGIIHRDSSLQSDLTESTSDAGKNNGTRLLPSSLDSTDQSQKYPDSTSGSSEDKSHYRKNY
ncbi:cation channel sperm-associated protein 4 [Thamnophis elegans]|uniref:cation channel sperm-associated protein 4 n=1 Tax=Thamnophis elegans TaxID=35005 RepID=UPI001376FC93|nr:cation channel sperm-associated protein 4 [Thamnophis elegans]